MELILLRHGKPDIDAVTAIGATAMKAWIAGYDAAGIMDLPDDSIVAACQGCFVVSSPMPRALASVEALGLKPDMIIDALSEAALPSFDLPLLKLNPLTWATLFRLLWMAGASGKVEAFSLAKKRARSVADTLTRLGEGKPRILSVGHGYMNMLIVRELQQAGWNKRSIGTTGYWSGVVLER